MIVPSDSLNLKLSYLLVQCFFICLLACHYSGGFFVLCFVCLFVCFCCHGVPRICISSKYSSKLHLQTSPSDCHIIHPQLKTQRTFHNLSKFFICIIHPMPCSSHERPVLKCPCTPSLLWSPVFFQQEHVQIQSFTLIFPLNNITLATYEVDVYNRFRND